MNKPDFTKLINEIKNKEVERPNKANAGTLSGHAAGEPFEKLVYHNLKSKYPQNIFKQYEFLNDIFLRNPKHITAKQRYALFDSPTALFLLSRGKSATNSWSPNNVFEEKQNDTADILYIDNGCYDIIDVKTRNIGKKAMEPNIISASKLAKACAIMLDNDDFDSIDIDYIEVDWKTSGDKLKATNAHHANLFKANPDTLYINWAAAMQIQFHVSDLDQTWAKTRKEWAKEYLTVFVASAKSRCDKMYKDYIEPYLKYIEEKKKRISEIPGKLQRLLTCTALVDDCFAIVLPRLSFANRKPRATRRLLLISGGFPTSPTGCRSR